jgi:hypothetical protein
VGSRVVLSFDGAILTEVELGKPVTVVGRHPACDICVDHPAISGRHMLFRVVNRTVYVEDLASTNGTKVNGLVAGHQVVHHLDLIEVGRHKLHFFDDAMLSGGVASLEETVHTDFERTLLVAHVKDEGLSRTQAIPRDPSLRMGPAQEVVRTRDEPAAAPAGRALALRVAAGPRTGDVIALEQANTMLGSGGADSALVVKRGEFLFLARFGGNAPPKLNRKELGPGTHRIAAQDVIDVGGSRYEVIQVAR